MTNSIQAERINSFSQIVLANKVDKKSRVIAFDAVAWESQGRNYGAVQKGFLVDGEFVKFGSYQYPKIYPSFEAAAKSTYRIAKERIANL
jgi:hypothetical protein